MRKREKDFIGLWQSLTPKQKEEVIKRFSNQIRISGFRMSEAAKGLIELGKKLNEKG